MSLTDETSFRHRANSDTSEDMDDDEFNTTSPSADSSSVASISPKIDSAVPVNFDIAYFLSLANQDVSSSSSESQSQGSRSGSPSDWQSSSWPGVAQPNDTWKWSTDSLMSDGVIDPSSLMLGGLGSDSEIFNQNSLYSPFSSLPPNASFDMPKSQTPTMEPIFPVPQIVEPPAAHPTGQTFPSNEFDANAIAQRARQLAGVEYAIPSYGAPTFAYPPPPATMLAGAPANVAGPSAPRSMSSAPPLGEFPAPHSAATSSAPSPETATSSRPKTDHTTIERRYRTNLNTRIVALRHAIPALRILEKDRFPNEQADERGYVDGVKAARKASKGSILGKATEYIRVLKRRELRLRREFDGIKSLVSGLVGGPELLAQWEHEWKVQHGSEETDEVGSDGDGDDEDGSDEEDDKPKKKPRVTPAKKKDTPTKSAPTAPAVAPAASASAAGELKRKRGRPRKVQPSAEVVPPAVLARTNTTAIPPYATQMPQAPPSESGKYLLGVFVLFSFLNPYAPHSNHPTTSSFSGHSHSHVGAVLTSLNSTLPSAAQYLSSSATPSSWSLANFVNYLHTLISIALFLSVLTSIFPSWSKWLMSAENSAPSKSEESNDAVGKDDLRANLGCEHVGFIDAAFSVLRASWIKLAGIFGGRSSNMSEVDRQSWVRLADAELLDNEALPMLRRVFMIAHLSSLPSLSPSELVTLSLLSYSLPIGLSNKFWARAQRLNKSRSKREQILFERSVDNALELFKAGVDIFHSNRPDREDSETITSLGLVASGYVCEQVKKAANELFIETMPAEATSVASQSELLEASAHDPDDMVVDQVKLSEVITLGKGLTRPVRELMHLWEDVSCSIPALLPLEGGRNGMELGRTDPKDDALSQATSFLEAIILYRHIAFSSEETSAMEAPSSPTPSDTSTLFAESRPLSASSSGSSTPTEISSRHTIAPLSSIKFGPAASRRLALLRVLASSVFDRTAQTEDARDRMVDYLRDVAWQ